MLASQEKIVYAGSPLPLSLHLDVVPLGPLQILSPDIFDVRLKVANILKHDITQSFNLYRNMKTYVLRFHPVFLW